MESSVPGIQALRQQFPAFDQHDFVAWFMQHALFQAFEADMQLMRVGGLVRHIPLIMSGSVKVSREDAEGREIFLYYILPGETCAMTLSACYKGEASRVNAVTQETSTLFLLPAELIHEATRRFPTWQKFAFDSFGCRFDELLHTLESVVFQQLDERLKHYLQEKAAALNSRQLHISQQQIADDLNASREVISRLIRQFEQKGYLKHARGLIEIFL
jgi:CRP/FNR family transcriptional regulator, anaerobic regulatory protein